MSDVACFGFYVGGPICSACAAAKRCRAILTTDGFNLAASLVEEMLENLPTDASFKETDRVSEMVAQLLKPPKESGLTAEEDELLGLIE